MTQKRAPRIVTVAVQGSPLKHVRDNDQRLDFLRSVLLAVDERWDSLDAVIFPGGYLRLPAFIGHLAHRGRASALRGAGFLKPIVSAINHLRRSPGAIVVTGMTSPSPGRGEWGDQLCCAWSRDGIAGFGRKIFPVARGADPESDGFVISTADFDSPSRVVQLASGHQAVLAACFDIFGVAESVRRNGVQANGIWWLREDGDTSWWAASHADRTSCVGRWESLLKRMRVTVALSSIHLFTRQASYFQRHGVATASAALSGYAVGAAHFHQLPSNPEISTLAAEGVPRSHLLQGVERRSHSWEPADFIRLGPALIRLYE